MEPTIPGYMHGWHDSGYINLAYIVELALNDGKDLKDDQQMGPQTGYLKDMKNMDEVRAAVEKQFQFWLDNFEDSSNKIDKANMEFKHLPFLSLLPRIGLLAGYGLVFGCCGYFLFERKEA